VGKKGRTAQRSTGKAQQKHKGQLAQDSKGGTETVNKKSTGGLGSAAAAKQICINRSW